MSTGKTTYLERDAADGARRFWQLTVEGKRVTLCFGRIGGYGRTLSKKFPSVELARKIAREKIAKKIDIGYARTRRRGKKRRAVRVAVPKASGRNLAPVLWKFKTGSHALGIFIDDTRCWIGNQSGQVYAVDHEARVLKNYKLPNGVKCIVADGQWVYAGCDNGNVYDLSGKVPRLAYEIAKNVNIFWLDIWGGILAVSDGVSKVTLFDAEGELRWSQKGKGSNGWMVRCDGERVFHGHSSGVDAYDMRTGKPAWKQPKAGYVLFGWQTETGLYIGTTNNVVRAMEKKTGKVTQDFRCAGGVPSCASSEDGKYVFGADFDDAIYCFEADGKLLWKLKTGCGSALSMQFWKDRLYVVTTKGALACIDASESAIEKAQRGAGPTARQVQAPRSGGIAASAELETTTSANGGVVVECVREGTRLRIRVVSRGYKKDWNVQFPRDVREEGARYVVESVVKSAGGDFYRAQGEIKRLV